MFRFLPNLALGTKRTPTVASFCIRDYQAFRAVRGGHRIATNMPASLKRKASTAAAALPTSQPDLPTPPIPKRRSTNRRAAPQSKSKNTNPDANQDILDAEDAVRASPGAVGQDEKFQESKVLSRKSSRAKNPAVKDDDSLPSLTKSGDSESDLSELPDLPPETDIKPKKTSKKNAKSAAVGSPGKPIKREAEPSSTTKQEQFFDPDVDDVDEADEEELQTALSRPPPVNSSVLPLPWEGRLGYACLNTYLRFSNPPVFASRTCRIASILENRHPLKFPDEPPHATKNRPDRDQPASVERGQRFVEALGLANARDCIKMLRWNHRYGIKFMRLSSEMFPFASHEEYGYKLAPFASEVLGEVGKIAAELGHRLTTHPGQFTQLGSPRKVVTENAVRDLEYHEEMLSLLKLPPQQDRDAVMILHLGGVFGDKEATLQRFRETYNGLSDRIKKRLVLENDDVSWSVHDLLPVCEELNIPFVLDFHHHNIIFDPEEIREGTKDIIDLFPRILATWRRKQITPKMHYSEPTPAAITGRQRRKHSPRVATLPPCPRDMDLMIEAKDKEQAVFELMRTFKLPGFETFSDIIPHVRNDENKPPKPARSKAAKKKQEMAEEEPEPPAIVPDEEVGMGGPEGRVYWPPSMEEWLRPKKRVIKKKESDETPKKKKKAVADKGEEEEESAAPAPTATPVKTKGGPKKVKAVQASAKKAKEKRAVELTETDSVEDEDAPEAKPVARRPTNGRRASRKQVNYNVDESD